MVFTVSTEGASKTTVLKKDGEPVARFYAGRADVALLKLIVAKLNA